MCPMHLRENNLRVSVAVGQISFICGAQRAAGPAFSSERAAPRRPPSTDARPESSARNPGSACHCEGSFGPGTDYPSHCPDHCPTNIAAAYQEPHPSPRTQAHNGGRAAGPGAPGRTRRDRRPARRAPGRGPWPGSRAGQPGPPACPPAPPAGAATRPAPPRPGTRASAARTSRRDRRPGPATSTAYLAASITPAITISPAPHNGPAFREPAGYFLASPMSCHVPRRARSQRQAVAGTAGTARATAGTGTDSHRQPR
jgi:hypothetical protein